MTPGEEDRMKTWNLKDTDLYHLLKDSRLEPLPGSPLGGLKPPAKSAKLAPVEDRAELVEALKRIARPDVIFGLVTFSLPEEPRFSWFYGSAKGADYAFHEPTGEGGHEVGWPVDAFLLLRSLQSPLAMEKLAEKEEVSLILDRSGFETLAAISDWLQEKNLLALLHRRYPREEILAEAELLETCGRSRNSEDWRWMMPRARLITPVALEFSDEAIRRGIDSLLAGELLVRRDGGFALTPALGLAGSRLAAVTGLSALSVRRFEDLSHFAALRVADRGLWLAEFNDITADEFSVRMTSLSSAEMYHRLKAGLGMPVEESPAPAAAPGRSGPPKKRHAEAKPEAAAPREPAQAPAFFCPSCGSELRAGAAFCSKCGYRLARKP